MCMTCGCGDLQVSHKDGDITLDMLQRAADNSELDLRDVAENIMDSVEQAESGKMTAQEAGKPGVPEAEQREQEEGQAR